MVIATRAGGSTVRAVALVGFFRGESLVKPGDILELSVDEFGMHKSWNQVDHAPAVEAPKPKGAAK